MRRGIPGLLIAPALALGVAFLLASRALAQTDVASILRANHAAVGDPPPRAATIAIRYAFAGFGLNGGYTSTSDVADGRYVNVLTVGPVTQVHGFDGKHAWRKDASGLVTQQDGGEQRGSAVTAAYQNANLWWRDDRGGAQITADGVKEDDAAPCDVLTITSPGGVPFEAWFDAHTHLLTRIAQKQGPLTVTDRFSDYRPTEGVMQAQKVVIDDSAGQVQTLTILDVRYGDGGQPVSFSAPETAPSDASIVGEGHATSLPFRLIDNRPYARVFVNGKGPFLFLIDTGSPNSITRSLAARLGIASEGQVGGYGAGEAVSKEGIAKIAELDIAGARIQNQVVAVDPDDLQDVEAAGDRGVLGFETFQRFVVQLDYGRRLATLIDPRSFDAKDAGTPVHLDFEREFVEAAGKFEGIPVRLVVDTGSRAEVVLNRPFVERNHLTATHPGGLDVVAGWGTGGPARAYATRAASLDVGSVPVAGVVAFFSTQGKGAFAGADFDGDIGGGVLKRFVVTFDYGRQTLYLKPTSSPATDVGTFDRAGLWFNRSKAGFAIVDVDPGGPAAKAGLAAGDEIVGVDGKPARSLTVYDLRRRLRDDRPGTVVTFSLRRNGRTRTSKVTLRDLI
jgi:predicted aspartyl protease